MYDISYIDIVDWLPLAWLLKSKIVRPGTDGELAVSSFVFYIINRSIVLHGIDQPTNIDLVLIPPLPTATRILCAPTGCFQQKQREYRTHACMGSFFFWIN